MRDREFDAPLYEAEKEHLRTVGRRHLPRR